MAGVFVQSTPLEQRIYEKPWFNHGTWRGVQTARWHSARLSLIGRHFADYKRSERESLATAAIGAVSWFSRLEVYGFHGLVDPQVAHQPAADGIFAGGLPGHEKWGLARAVAKRPTFILYSRKLHPRPALPAEVPTEFSALLDREYRIASVRLVDEANGEEGYLSFLERTDRESGGSSPSHRDGARAVPAGAQWH